ncbi:MAG: response regulator, partial [Desulfovibrio sp.]
RLIDLMNGNLAIVSTEGKGTTVYASIPFPVPQDTKPQASTELLEMASCPRGLSILLAEDDLVSRIAATRLLEKAHASVTAVENGELALEALGKGTFDVVLMDVQMPRMGGVEAAKAIRAGQAGQDKADVPIIALTAFAMAGDTEEFRSAGMNAHVAKPVELKSLVRVLGEVVEKTSSS